MTRKTKRTKLRSTRKSATSLTHASKNGHGELPDQNSRPPNWRKSVRSICRDLVTQHSTDIQERIRLGMRHKKAGIALRYIAFVASYESGKPVETHRMVGMTEGPEGTYDLSRLDPQEQQVLLKLLKKSKDSATASLPPASPDVPDTSREPELIGQDDQDEDEDMPV